jgi:hypothetical protein
VPKFASSAGVLPGLHAKHTNILFFSLYQYLRTMQLLFSNREAVSTLWIHQHQRPCNLRGLEGFPSGWSTVSDMICFTSGRPHSKSGHSCRLRRLKNSELMQGRALGGLGPGPQALRCRALSNSVPVRCLAQRPSFSPSARQGKKASEKAPRAEQATSTATTEQELQHATKSNGNGSAPTEVKLTEKISHGLQSDLEVDSVLAKEMGENGECCGIDLPACFNTFLLNSAYSIFSANRSSPSDDLDFVNIVHSIESQWNKRCRSRVQLHEEEC